jgi:hypothetical protein
MLLAIAPINHPAAAAIVHQSPPPPQLDVFMLCSFVAAFFAIVFYKERRNVKEASLALAPCLAFLAVFACMRGAWPVSMVLIVQSIAAVRYRWTTSTTGAIARRWSNRWPIESRMTRMFGAEATDDHRVWN